jgi:hypothetical protein
MEHAAVTKTQKISPVIIGAGVATSAVALVLEYFLSSSLEFSLMGLYLWFIIPAGALILGCIAGAGYGIASWKTGTRISAAMMPIVLILQTGVYLLAHYVRFASFDPPLVFEDGTLLTFTTYFDYITQTMAFEDGEPLEMWGYAFRALEVVGFAVGSLAGVAIMRGKPYCEACQRYMKTRSLLWLPASPDGKAPGRKASLGEAEAWQQSEAEAFEAGHTLATEILEGAAGGDLAPYDAARARYADDRKSTLKLPVRLALDLQHCKSCLTGQMLLNQHLGHGEEAQSQLVAVGGLPENAVRQLVS